MLIFRLKYFLEIKSTDARQEHCDLLLLFCSRKEILYYVIDTLCSKRAKGVGEGHMERRCKILWRLVKNAYFLLI